MTIFISFLLLVSLVANGIFVWYTRLLVKQVWASIKGVDSFQDYLTGYQKNLESIYELTDFYGDQTIKGVIDDTKAVVEACQNFKVSVLGEQIEEAESTDKQ